MSFGFSISDIAGCAHLVYKLYFELKAAPGVCGTFANELFQFWEILREVEQTILSKKDSINDTNRERLEEYANSCTELCNQILSATDIPYESCFNNDYIVLRPIERVKLPDRLFKRLSRLGGTLGQARLARKIPEYRRAISAQIESLTAFNVLLIRSAYTWRERERD